MNEFFIPEPKTEDSKHDERTIKHEELAMAGVIPPSFEIKFNLPHKNQKKIGICTASTVTMMAEKYFGDPKWKGSMEWLYKIGKTLIDKNTTEGSSIFTMLKAAQKYGIPSESKYPSNCDRTYAEFMSDTNITQDMLDDAAKHKIPGYASVPANADSLKKALVDSKCGLATRMSLGNTFWVAPNGETTWDKAKLELIRPPKTVTSGHAIILAGYDQNIFLKRNSWSEQWCDNGDCHYDYNEMKPYVTEAWTIVDLKPEVIEQVKKSTGKFTKDLKFGITDNEVKLLQEFLYNQGFPVAETGAGSKGNYTYYFGNKSFNALKLWQKSVGLPPTGYWGRLSRAKAESVLK